MIYADNAADRINAEVLESMRVYFLYFTAICFLAQAKKLRQHILF